MNKDWSEKNTTIQTLIKRRETFGSGIAALMELRNCLMDTIDSWRKNLKDNDFSAIPFINATGYHNKTIAYSLWHIFRIEDIVAHTLIKEDEQVFFSDGFQQRIGSPIITTGNELVKQQIADFSNQLNIDELYAYIHKVKSSTELLINSLNFDDMKRAITDNRKAALKSLNVVSDAEEAVWLIDYWCDKDIRGLIQMPFSRHWIMHTEACIRIIKKLV